MIRILVAISILLGTLGVATAQEFTGLARVLAADSRVTDGTRDEVELNLHLSQGVPYRVFTLDAPHRLVLDFQEVDWRGLD